MRIAASALLAAMLASGAGRAQTPLFDAEGGETAARGLRGAFSCPVDKLTELYRGLAPRELPAAMAVETEILLICAERQEKIQALLEAEIRLRRLMDIPDPPPGSPRISVAEGVEAAPPPRLRCEPDSSPGAVVAATAAPPVESPPPSPPALALASDAAIRLLADSLSAVAESRRVPAESANACEAAAGRGGWSWIWTARDASGRPLAALRSPEGVAVEVREGDVLSDGARVSVITAGGVAASPSRGGPAELLPRDAGEADRPDAETLGIPPDILERMRGG